MAKSKKQKKPIADAVYAKKSTGGNEKSNPFALAKPATSKKLNPFEVHVNKEKFQILGRICKHDRGLPGVSRAKAVKRRKQTLGVEFMQKHKSNQFYDRRIGKNLDATELTEDVLNARFLADKMTHFKTSKASKFDLNDDEVLTHRGQTLEEIEKFRDERSDDEELDDQRLDADFTEAAHFGGGDTQLKDRKAAIEEMIIEQKKRKIEIAKEKDELHNLTDKLDSNYKELVGVMGKMAKKGDKEKPPQDDFDKLMREMIFEPRGAVTDKLQSEEDIAKNEKERLERLEQQRLKRMQGEHEETNEKEIPKHRSADDLDDGYFAYGAVEDEPEGTLAYNMEGELGTKITHNGQENDAASESGADETGSELDTEEEEEGDNSDDEEQSDDDLSDLKANDSDDEPSEATKKSTDSAKLKKSKSAVTTDAIEGRELPYTIEMPAKYEEFTALLSGYTPEDQAIIVERLIKCNHPKLDGVNREKVVKLFAFLMQHINELFSEATPENIAAQFKMLNSFNPHLYDLMQLNAERMSTTLLEVIKEKYANYRKQPKVFPTLDTLIYFKLVSNYFSTSDFRHPVVTPCFIFIEHILERARVVSRRDIAAALFLITIVLEYTQQSRRFLPACFNYLLGILFLCVPKRAVELIKIVAPFQARGASNTLLVLTKEEHKNACNVKEALLTSEDLLMESITTEFKVRALNFCLQLVHEACDTVGENIGANYLADPLLKMMERIPLEIYPAYIKQRFDATKAALSAIVAKPLTKLVPPEKKPKALRLLEPRIETVYDDKRRPKMSKEKEEKAKLLHKLKRETKGAVREIRRDTEFLQKMRIQQQMQSDLVRKEKVRRIFHEASVQQGELNELARARKRKKF